MIRVVEVHKHSRTGARYDGHYAIAIYVQVSCDERALLDAANWSASAVEVELCVKAVIALGDSEVTRTAFSDGFFLTTAGLPMDNVRSHLVDYVNPSSQHSIRTKRAMKKIREENPELLVAAGLF